MNDRVKFIELLDAHQDLPLRGGPKTDAQQRALTQLDRALMDVPDAGGVRPEVVQALKKAIASVNATWPADQRGPNTSMHLLLEAAAIAASGRLG